MAAKKRAPQRGAANKKTVPRAKEKSAPPRGGTGRTLAGIACFGLAVLLFYLALTTPVPGTAMGAVKDVLRGVGGSLAAALPLVFVWIGALLVASGQARRLAPLRIVADALLIFAVFAAVELFHCEAVAASGYQGVDFGYFDFVSKAYRLGRGGGALGALLARPLYRSLGAWGGLIVLVVAAILITAAEGRLNGLFALLRERHAAARERRLEARELRAEGDMLDADDDIDHPFAPRGYAGAAELDREAEEKPRRSARKPRGSVAMAETRPAPEPVRSLFSVSLEGGSTSRKRRKDAPAEDVIEDIPADPIVPAFSASAPVEEIASAEPEAVDAGIVSTGTKKSARAKGKKKEPARQPDTETFTPDESYAHHVQPEEEIDDLFEPQGYEGHADPAPAAAEDDEFVPFDKQDLRIVPDEYETPDDEAPFDVPKAGDAKKELPKLRRVDPEEVREAEPEPYNYPPLDLLPHGSKEEEEADEEADLDKARQLGKTLESFGIATTLTGIAHGPAVTRFELKPAPGVKVSRITTLADDIALNLAATRVRIEAPIPGKPAVGVEIPNDKVETVPLRDVLESPEARKHPSRIAVALGKDNSGRYIVADIAKMPHVLIAGQTGSGKSVCINSIIISILYRATPEEVKMILIDPKVVELSVYNEIPHLISPVVTDPKKAASALQWAVSEMEGRYKKFAERNVRNIKGYNASLKEGEKPMPHMVIIIDELADLMMVAPGEVEDSICRLAQLARAAGMHLVIATQRPSVNVITGIIKANIPTRIAFLVASQVDSRTIIDHGGAEKLLGYGDMLFVPSGAQKSIRVQGAWVSDDEVNSVVEYIKARHESTYDEDMVEKINSAVMSDAEKEEALDEYDPRLPEAVEIVIEAGQASISMLQRRMRVGYARAGRLIDEMALRGIVSIADGSKPRDVLVTREQFQQMFEDEEDAI